MIDYVGQLSIFNYPIETESAYHFWSSNHKCNIAQAFIAFSLDEDNFNELGKRHGYTAAWRDRMWAAYGFLVNQPEMDTVTQGFVYKELSDHYWDCMPNIEEAMDTPAQIVVVTSDQYVDLGKHVQLFVVTHGTEVITYQWSMQDSFGDWIELIGETEDTITYESILGTHYGVYSCVATNAFGSHRSKGMTIFESGHEPVVTLNPLSQEAAVGSTVVFIADADNYDTVQWYRNGRLLDNGSSVSISVLVTNSNKLDLYSAMFINQFGTIHTSSAGFYEDPLLLLITEQPHDFTGHEHSPAEFCSDAVNYDSVQWFIQDLNTRRFVEIPGATTDSLSISLPYTGSYEQVYAIYYKGTEFQITRTASVLMQEAEEPPVVVLDFNQPDFNTGDFI